MPLFALIIIVFQAIVFLGHWFLYKTVIRFFGLRGSAPLVAAFALLSVSFICASVLVFRYNKALVDLFYTLAAIWLGVFHFLLWCSFLCWMALWAHRALGFHFRPMPWAAAFYAIGLALSVCSLVNASTVRTKEIDLALPGLPAEWRGRTAVLTSDLHLGPVRGRGFAIRIARKIKRLHPDILFIAGDLYDGTSGDPARLAAPFAEIKPPLGAWFITGNHEEFSAGAKQTYIRAVREAGIHVLENEWVEIDGLQLAGVDYTDTFTAAKYRAVLEKMVLGGRGPVILLKHSPMYPEVAREDGVALQLSGHTHGGQIFPASLVTHLVYKGFDSGLRRQGGLTAYTSSGTGTWGPPMRFGTAPEIVLIRFF